MTQAGHNMTDPGTSLVLRAVLNGRRRLLAARLLAAVCVCLSLSYSAHGQDVQFTQGSVSSGLDNTVQISLASYPGRGATGLPVTLYYSSKVWRVGYIRSVRENSGIYTITRPVAEAIYAEHSASGWTTSLDVPRVEWPRQDDVYWYDGKPYHSSVGPYTYRVARVFIHLADGSSHELRRADAVYADAGVVEKSGVYYAVDGSRLRYDADAAVLYMPDGARYEMGDDAVVRLIDRNGNALTYTLSDVAPGDDPGGNKKRVTKVTDAGGRAFDIEYYSRAEARNAHVRGKVKRVLDHSGSALEFEYYDDGNLRRLRQPRPADVVGEDPGDRVFTFTYTTPSGDGPAIPAAADRVDPDPRT
ncbi:MAG TPA: hypothetical protein VF654_14235, partial [Pyrinomonadaceae bacterium]